MSRLDIFKALCLPNCPAVCIVQTCVNKTNPAIALRVSNFWFRNDVSICDVLRYFILIA